MRDQVAKIVATEHSGAMNIGIIDETSFVKKGEKTPRVQRQHCGAVGKHENCHVTVHLSFASSDFHCLVDGDLFLPESWSDDRERCRAAKTSKPAFLDALQSNTQTYTKNGDRLKTPSAVSLLFLARERQSLLGEYPELTIRKVRQAASAMVESWWLPPKAAERLIANTACKIQYHQKRNRQARESHIKTRVAKLQEMGIDLTRRRRCHWDSD